MGHCAINPLCFQKWGAQTEMHYMLNKSDICQRDGNEKAEKEAQSLMNW
jgi:hypothetical protein